MPNRDYRSVRKPRNVPAPDEPAVLCGKIYGIWCEWDIGQEGTHFTSREKAMRWLEENEALREALEAEDDCNTIQDLIDVGLVTITEEDLD